MNSKPLILNELSEISIHLQYMPTAIDDSPENQKYFDYFQRAIDLRNELKLLDSKDTE